MTETQTQALQQCRDALRAEQAQSLAETGNWAHVDKQQVHRDWDALYRRLAPLIEHQPASAESVQACIAEHHSIISRFYTPSKQAYIGMSLLYAEDQDMRQFHSAYHRNMVPFLAEAIAIYADAHL